MIQIRDYDLDPGLRSRSWITIQIRDYDLDPGLRSGSRIAIPIQDHDPIPGSLNVDQDDDDKLIKLMFVYSYRYKQSPAC